MLRFLYFGHFFLHALYLTKNIAIAAQAIITTYISDVFLRLRILESWLSSMY